jgi:hypothetical protein
VTASLTKDDFDALDEQVRQWNEPTSRGMLDRLTPDRVVATAHLVRPGLSVGLSLPITSERRPDHPTRTQYRMTALSDGFTGRIQFVKDYLGAHFHNDGHTHIDAFCQVSYGGRFYGGAPIRPWPKTARGSTIS